MLDIKNIFDINESSRFLEELARKPSNDQIFENFFIEAILNLKWRKQKSAYIVETLNYFIFLIIFTAEIIYMLPNRTHPVHQSDYQTSIALSSLVLTYCLSRIYYEIKQLRDVGTYMYMSSIWNLLDWSSIFLTIPAFILNLIDISSGL